MALYNNHWQQTTFVPHLSSLAMVRIFYRSESTKQVLSDVRHMSWCSYRSTASYFIKNGTEEESQHNQKEDDKLPLLNEKYYQPSALTLYAELSNVAPKKSAFSIETVVRRTGNFYTMDLQLPKKTIPLFVANLHGQTYVLKSAPQDDGGDVIMGTVCKRPTSHSDKTKLTYVLTHHQHSHKPQKIAFIDYHHPPLYQLLRDNKARPRRCQVRVLDRGTVNSKEPYYESGYLTLDFKGRGREASIKNMQLDDPHGKEILQMVKWDRDVFHVDFSYPFDAFHAFGFALAQFDL
jgi:hypothetical protein